MPTISITENKQISIVVFFYYIIWIQIAITVLTGHCFGVVFILCLCHVQVSIIQCGIPFGNLRARVSTTILFDQYKMQFTTRFFLFASSSSSLSHWPHLTWIVFFSLFFVLCYVRIEIMSQSNERIIQFKLIWKLKGITCNNSQMNS